MNKLTLEVRGQKDETREIGPFMLTPPIGTGGTL